MSLYGTSNGCDLTARRKRLLPRIASTATSMFIKQAKLGQTDNFGYLVADEKTKLAAVIDPSMDARPLQNVAVQNGFRIIYILNTHDHHDHTTDNGRLAQETGAKIAAHRLARTEKDIPLEDGDVLRIGELELKVLHTPGHSVESCCFIVDKALFTGDTLFVGECGRTDLPRSDVRAMHDSLLNKIVSLDDDLVVYPGHDYGKTPSSPLGYEKKHNYTLKPRSLPEFIKFMSEP